MSRRTRPLPFMAAILAALLLLVTACGSDDGAGGGEEPDGGSVDRTASGEIEIDDAYIPLSPAANMAALYLHLHNGTDVDDALIGVEIEGAGHADLHRTEITDDGLSRMVDLDRIDLPAGDEIVFEPGGLHVMIDDPPELDTGETVRVTLRFETADEMTIDARVTEPGADDDHHDHHDHDDHDDHGEDHG